MISAKERADIVENLALMAAVMESNGLTAWAEYLRNKAVRALLDHDTRRVLEHARGSVLIAALRAAHALPETA